MSKKLWRVGAEELEYVRQAIEGGLTGKYTKKFEFLGLSFTSVLI